MAYNSYAFETVYGFSLLDEIHNFFPELLYDDTLFNSESMSWMRFRVNRLFPNVYVRQHNMYNMYSASQRMNEYVQWHHNHIPRVQPPPAPRRNPSSTAVPFFSRNNTAPPPPTEPFITPIDISGVRTPPHSLHNNRVLSFIYDIRDPAVDNAAANLLNLFNLAAFQDVSVAPSSVQIEEASTVRLQEDISSETNCSICMEHNATNGSQDWRELNCGHVFHRQCIDTWLSSHVQCPNCRRDVRTMVHRPPSS